jgi:PAS domain S-box-containing protein
MSDLSGPALAPPGRLFDDPGDGSPLQPAQTLEPGSTAMVAAMNIFRRRRTLGIQTRLVILILVTVLPLVGLSSFTIVKMVDRERSQIQRDVRERVQTLLANVDREIERIQVSLLILASSPSLAQGDFEAFASQIKEALKIQGLAIGLHDRAAGELVSTTRPYGEGPTRRTNRDMVDHIVRTGKPHISNLFMGTAFQRQILTVGVPVLGGESVAYVLTMALDPNNLSIILRGQNLPSAWTAEIFDRKGIIVARYPDLEQFFGQPATPALREEISRDAAGWLPNVSSSGLHVYSAFLRSPITGWTVAISVPTAVIDGPLYGTYLLASGAGMTALVLSLGLAWWMARTIRWPVAAVTAAARRMGSGGPLDPLAPGVREFDEIADALRTSADELDRRGRAREAAEAALREGEERFRTLAESLPQLVWTFLPDGRCDYLSRQLTDYTGISTDEQLGSEQLRRVIHPDDFAITAASWVAAQEERGDYDIEHRLRSSDGSYRWFKTRATALRDRPGRIVKWFGTCTDIQEIVETREELTRGRAQLETMVLERTRELAATNKRLTAEIAAREQAQAALAQAQKMEAMGQLTGGIAHDFNNLLTIASGSLELLEGRISDEKSVRLLRSAQGAMARGARLTGSLLAFARKQRLEPVLADLNSVVVEVTDLLRRSIGPTVDVRYALSNAPWPTLIDTGQIETAILNIAINARDAMPSGGTLLIETANIPAGDNDMPQEVVCHDCVLLSMSDTGTGMSPEVIEHAFEPFFTTKEIGKGTGLGLSTVFGVVRQSGGAVRIRSRIGEGTTVRIYLPRANTAAAVRAGDTMPARRPASGGARVLVVDDDAAVRWVTVECLRESGHFVTEADSGRTALAILERGDPCDLVVMDQLMPGLLGTETVRLARMKRPELKVLFVTGYAEKFELEEATDPLIMKPFKSAVLVEAVRGTLQKTTGNRVGNVVQLMHREGPNAC